MKSKIVNVISILLIATGVGIVGWIVSINVLSNSKNEKLIQEFDNTMTEGSGENKTTPDTGVSDTELSAIAIITIPKIDLKVATVEGTNDDDLKVAVGHFDDTAYPGQVGNFAVAGHRSYTYNQYFNRAEELVKGDEILVKSKDGEFKYVIYDSFIVDPYAWDKVVNADPERESIMTIMTCTPGGERRYVIKAELKK